MYGKEGVLRRRREAELEHEKQLAAIRRGGRAPEAMHAITKQGEEIERRKGLLAEYKAATAEPSNRQIYEADNSQIHKPQFYRWLKGTLPSSSGTAVNFERFLRENNPPTARKKRS